jgi:hypothetical protein
MEYKTPLATLDFTQDWSSWLATGDTVTVSAWTLETGLTEDSSSNTTTTATIVISGGTAGKVYKVENTVTTANGLDTSRIWFLTVQDQLV